LLSSLTHFNIYVKQTALLNVHILFSCLYNIYILIILKLSISQYFQNIVSVSCRNWNPDIESSLLRSDVNKPEQSRPGPTD